MSNLITYNDIGFYLNNNLSFTTTTNTTQVLSFSTVGKGTYMVSVCNRLANENGAFMLVFDGTNVTPILAITTLTGFGVDTATINSVRLNGLTTTSQYFVTIMEM